MGTGRRRRTACVLTAALVVACCTLLLPPRADSQAPAWAGPSVEWSAQDPVQRTDDILRRFPKIADTPDARKALKEMFRRLEGNIPLHQDGARAELRQLRSLVGNPAVQRLYVVPSDSSGRTSDFGAEIRDRNGSVKRVQVEVKAAAARRAGKHHGPRTEQPRRREVTRHALRSAVRRLVKPLRGKPPQLARVLRVLPGPGRPALRFPTGGIGVVDAAHGTPRKTAAAVRAVMHNKRFLRRLNHYCMKYKINPVIRFQISPQQRGYLTFARSRVGVWGEVDREERPAAGLNLFGIQASGPRCLAGDCDEFSRPDSGPSFPAALAQMAAESPGGIDFSSLELRYLSVGEGEVDYAFKVDAGARRGEVQEGVQNAEQASDAFFVWLALPRTTHWVNLKPNEPDRVVDRDLGRTMVGKVMLQADLALKHADGRLIDPRQPFGARVWRETGGCLTGRRLWITPAPARVREDGDALYILEAPLAVSVEGFDYRPGAGDPRPPGAQLCPGLSEDARTRHLATYRRLVIPRLTRIVNHSREFAALRRIYVSRVAAEWYREQSAERPTPYASIVDSGRIGRWAGTGGWRPPHTFRAYLRSSFTATTGSSGARVTRSPPSRWAASTSRTSPGCGPTLRTSRGTTPTWRTWPRQPPARVPCPRRAAGGWVPGRASTPTSSSASSRPIMTMPPGRTRRALGGRQPGSPLRPWSVPVC